MTMAMIMPRNPGEAEWLIRSAEEEAARAARWAAVAQQHATYQSAMAKAHAADAAGLRMLWNIAAAVTSGRTESVIGEAAPEETPAEPLEMPKCLYCGSPTRIYHGRPQKFCSVSFEHPNNCAQRYRDRQKLKIIREAREKIRSKTTIAVSCTDTSEEGTRITAAPSCLNCGKTTRIWHGKPQKFCTPPEGKKNAGCFVQYSKRERQSSARRRAPKRLRRAKKVEPAFPTGSVLATASPRAPGYALLASVTLAVPQHLPEDFRQDVIGEALMLCSQGMELEGAVAQATKKVRKDSAMLRYAKSIDDCFWLASDVPDEGLSQTVPD